MIIHSGRGWVEWRGQKTEIQAGQAFRLLPGEWHRYRPDPLTGWHEEWFEFRGPLVFQWARQGNLSRPIYSVPKREGWRSLSKEFHTLAIKSGREISPRLFGLALSIFAEVTGAFVTEPGTTDSRRSDLVARAGEALERGMEVREAARALGVSYPTLHRCFREVLGVSPKQFAERSRWAKAEEHLASDLLSIKEIAAHLGFHSPSHFSMAFRKAYGSTPVQWRRRCQDSSTAANP